MKSTLFVPFIIVIMLLPACNNSTDFTPTWEFEEEGQLGSTVNELQLVQNFLYAATQNGIWRKVITNQSAVWQRLGFEGKNIQSMHVFSLNTILVSIVDEEAPENNTIQFTVNEGNNWTERIGGWGGVDMEPLYDIAVDPNDPNVLYGTGAYAIAKSVDKGQTWDLVFGGWDNVATGIRTIAVNPNSSSEIWAGGQNASNQGVLLNNFSSGQEGQWSMRDNLVEAPTVVKEIEFDALGGAIYTGWEGAILKSTDNGSTWSTVLESTENRFFFAIEASEVSAGTVYAAGWLEGFEEAPQRLVIFKTTDAGSTWEEIESQQQFVFGGVFDMVLQEDAFGTILYLGLYRDGVQSALLPK